MSPQDREVAERPRASEVGERDSRVSKTTWKVKAASVCVELRSAVKGRLAMLGSSLVTTVQCIALETHLTHASSTSGA